MGLKKNNTHRMTLNKTEQGRTALGGEHTSTRLNSLRFLLYQHAGSKSKLNQLVLVTEPTLIHIRFVITRPQRFEIACYVQFLKKVDTAFQNFHLFLPYSLELHYIKSDFLPPLFTHRNTQLPSEKQILQHFQKLSKNTKLEYLRWIIVYPPDDGNCKFSQV